MSFRSAAGWLPTTAAAATLTTAAIIGLARPAHAQEGQTVAEVTVNGVANTNRDTVLLTAATKTGKPFASATFEEDKKAIRDLGLYASVGGRVETTPDNKLRVVFDVVENPVISKIDVSGNKALSRERLRGEIRSVEGQVLNTQTVLADIQRIQRLYSQNNFLAYVDESAGIDPKTGVLTFPIVETTVESVQFTNNNKTRDFVLRREMKTKVGEPYNSQTLVRDLTRLMNLGYFEDVGPARPEAGTDLGRVRLVIPVQERRTGTVGVSFGYSSRQRLVGALELSEANFRGRGQAVNFRWEVGGIASRNSFEVGFSDPYLLPQRTGLSVSLFDRVVYRFNRSLSSNISDGLNDDQYYERRQGGAATLVRPFGEFTRGYLTLRAEKIGANDLGIDYNALDAQGNPVFTNDQINNLRGSLVQNGNVASLTLRGSTNTRDNDLDPARGGFFSPSVEVGNSRFSYQKPLVNPAYVSAEATPGVPRILVDDRVENGAFSKVNLDFRRYLSLSGPRRASLAEPKRVLAGRLLLGKASGVIGFSEQYFVGGAETLRGYNEDRFWGNNLFLASLELRLPLDNRGTVTGVLFTDVGDAWGATENNRENIRNFEQHGNFSPRVGLGLGVRLKTPVGPVRLDYGFGEGGHAHFSIGQVF